MGAGFIHQETCAVLLGGRSEVVHKKNVL
jgi:hypothetical protein